jgi:hypothetical protein
LSSVLEKASSTMRLNLLYASPCALVVMSPMYSAAPKGAPACWSRKTVNDRLGQVASLDAEGVEPDLVDGG